MKPLPRSGDLLVRLAVVLIHGIGEQIPMGTIRPFAEALLATGGERGRFYSKPDRMSELFELRKLQAVGNRRIHFYEYYWACHVEGSKAWEVVRWAGRLMLRRFGRCPRRHEILVGDPVAAGDPRGDHDRLRRGERLYDWYKAQRTLGAVWVAITLSRWSSSFSSRPISGTPRGTSALGHGTSSCVRRSGPRESSCSGISTNRASTIGSSSLVIASAA